MDFMKNVYGSASYYANSAVYGVQRGTSKIAEFSRGKWDKLSPRQKTVAKVGAVIVGSSVVGSGYFLLNKKDICLPGEAPKRNPFLKQCKPWDKVKYEDPCYDYSHRSLFTKAQCVFTGGKNIEIGEYLKNQSGSSVEWIKGKTLNSLTFVRNGIDNTFGKVGCLKDRYFNNKNYLRQCKRTCPIQDAPREKLLALPASTGNSLKKEGVNKLNQISTFVKYLKRQGGSFAKRTKDRYFSYKNYLQTCSIQDVPREKLLALPASTGNSLKEEGVNSPSYYEKITSFFKGTVSWFSSGNSVKPLSLNNQTQCFLNESVKVEKDGFCNDNSEVLIKYNNEKLNLDLSKTNLSKPDLPKIPNNEINFYGRGITLINY